ncbi:MAG: hypothetical protein LUG13_06535 [Oscillospiraceae bacterium]|nr:hypothetical protein [Oscillospiraceae bacterium]
MKWKKAIAPIVITVLLVAALVAYLIALLYIPLPPAMRIIVILVLLALIGVQIFVLTERMQEIRSGEEDDLGQY